MTADIGQFKAKMAEAKGEVATLNKSGSSNFQNLSTYGKAALLGLGAVAVGVAVVSVKAAMDWESAHARLTTAIKNSGSTFAEHSSQITSLDTKMRGLGFTDSDTETSMSRLVTATKNVGLSTQLMGLAADIARARNIDLVSATDMLVKVEGGRYLALSKTLGVSKEVIAGFHNQGDAVKYLTDRFGGQGAAYADSFAGKVDRIKAAGDHLAVGLGEILVPVVLTMGEAFASTVTWITSNQVALDAVEVAVGILGAALVLLGVKMALSAVIGAATAAFSFFAGILEVVTSATLLQVAALELLDVVMAAVTSPIGLVVGGLLLLGAAYKGITSGGGGLSLSASQTKAFSDALLAGDPAVQGMTKFTIGLGEAHKTFLELLKQSPAAAEKYMESAQAAGVSITGWSGELHKHVAASGAAKDATDAFNKKAAEQNAAANYAKGGIDALNQSYADAAANVKGLKTAQDNLNLGTEDVSKASLKFSQSLQGLKENLFKTQGDMLGTSAAALDNRQKFNDAKDAGDAFAASLGATSAGAKGATLAYMGTVQSLYDAAKATGISDQAALDYTKTVVGVPQSAFTSITSTAAVAEWYVNQHKGAIDAVKAIGTVNTAFTVDTYVASLQLSGLAGQFSAVGQAAVAAGQAVSGYFGGGGAGGGGSMQHRAGGGRAEAGVPYIVGENRPEIFVPDVSGTIVPRVPATSSGMQEAGVTDRSINVNGVTIVARDPSEAMAALRAELAWHEITRGRD